MCGLTGFLSTKAELSAQKMRTIVSSMSETLTHRGPDDDGFWLDEAAGMALGFRRLAIVDLSPNGHQPMLSACGRFALVFNGEVYNFKELRQVLESKGHQFRGHSDTEIILAAIVEWGLEAAVKQFVGMFAFALWDRTSRQLSLVRDRLGIKPLYYGWTDSAFLFGSELKALRRYPDFECRIDRNNLTQLLRHNMIPAPYSIYKSIYKLLPGSILTISNSNEKNVLPVHYWSAKKVITQQLANPFLGDEQDAIEELNLLLHDAIGRRMIADVPLGAFLSGGIDSSTVVALMQAQSSRPIKTFSIGFNESAYDEAKYAKSVAKYLGTEHTELYITPTEAQTVIQKLPEMYDEPFADSSQIPTFLLSQMTRQYVTVTLSGDGGDELFAGYNNYFTAPAIWEKIKWIPISVRRNLAHLIGRMTPESYNRLFHFLSPLTARYGSSGPVGHKLLLLSELLSSESSKSLFYNLVSHSKTPSDIVLGGTEPTSIFTEPNVVPLQAKLTQEMMFLDLVGYLPDDILTKVDRASMAVSLEARVPLLDHRLVEFAWRIPLSMKIRNGKGKWLLRQALYKYVPKELIERPKMGFGIPLHTWLRSDLCEWAESLLDESRLRREGFFDPALIRQKWNEHLSGARNWQHFLWNVLMFQLWLEHTNSEGPI